MDSKLSQEFYHENICMACGYNTIKRKSHLSSCILQAILVPILANCFVSLADFGERRAKWEGEAKGNIY